MLIKKTVMNDQLCFTNYIIEIRVLKIYAAFAIFIMITIRNITYRTQILIDITTNMISLI